MVPARVRELDGVAVLDAGLALGPVVAGPGRLVVDCGCGAHFVLVGHGPGSNPAQAVQLRLVPGQKV